MKKKKTYLEGGGDLVELGEATEAALALQQLGRGLGPLHRVGVAG